MTQAVIEHVECSAAGNGPRKASCGYSTCQARQRPAWMLSTCRRSWTSSCNSARLARGMIRETVCAMETAWQSCGLGSLCCFWVQARGGHLMHAGCWGDAACTLCMHVHAHACTCLHTCCMHTCGRAVSTARNPYRWADPGIIQRMHKLALF